MTQVISMRTTELLPSAPRPAAGGRLRHAQAFRLASYGASSGGADAGQAGVLNRLPKTKLAAPIGHFTGIRSFKSP